MVEDNADDELLTLRSLKKGNIKNEIRVAHDGAEALEMLGQGALPQVVLLDLKLPKIDGLEVLRRLRSEERTRLLPVVILTSSKEESDVLSGYKYGANAYVVKPVDLAQFSQAVAQLGLFWLLVNEFPGGKHVG